MVMLNIMCIEWLMDYVTEICVYCCCHCCMQKRKSDEKPTDLPVMV